MRSRKLNSYNSAFTLIELLVGMVLALIVTAAAATIYLSSKETNRLNQEIINAQNEGQLALQVLRDNIRNAGWAEDDYISYTLAAPIDVDQSSNSDGAGSDALTVLNRGIFDCNGVGDPTNGMVLISNTFAVSDGNLTCNDQPIISNVDSLQVLYGVDQGSGLEYVTLDNVGNSSFVQSIQIGFSVSSEQSVSDGNQSQNIKLLDVDLPEFTDKKVRYVYTLTIAILNRPQVIAGII